MSSSEATITVQPQPQSSGWIYWPLVIAIIVGGVLRMYRLGTNSLWVDEFATLALSTHSPVDIVRMSSHVNFIPPLYFLLVHGALQLWGESEVTLRLPSVIAGLCTIPVIWLLTQEITQNRTTANTAALLLAVNPLHLWYSQEARPYAVMLLFGCCACLSLERAAQTRSLFQWIMFCVYSGLSFLTHTTGVMFGLIAWVWVLCSADRRHLLRPLAASSLAILLVCSPFVIAIARALMATHGTFHSPPRALTGLEVAYTLLTYVGGYSFGPAPREIQNFGALAALRSHPIQSAIAGGVVCAVLGVSWLKRRAAMVPFIVLLAVPLAWIIILSALTGKAYNVRYTLPALVGFLGIISIAASNLKPSLRHLWLSGFIGLGLWADGQWFYWSLYAKEDSRAAISWLRENLVPGMTVAVAPNYSVRPLAYYARKAGVQLRFLPLQPGIDLEGVELPDALVLTRLHHVANWRELKADFLLTGGRVLEGHVVGYEILARPLPGSR